MNKDALFAVEPIDKPFSAAQLAKMKLKADRLRHFVPILMAIVMLSCAVAFWHSYAGDSEYREALIMASAWSFLLLPMLVSGLTKSVCDEAMDMYPRELKNNEVGYLVAFIGNENINPMLVGEVSEYLGGVAAMGRRLTLADYRVVERFINRYSDVGLPEVKHPFYREQPEVESCGCSLV